MLTYFVRSTETESGIEISLDEMTMQEINGADLPDAVAPQALAQFMVADFVVGFDGVGIGVVGIEEMLAQMRDAGMIEVAALPPQAIALLEETVLTKYWGSWVGFWAELGGIDFTRVSTSVPLAVGDTQVTIDLVVESLPTGAGEATLRSVQTLTGDDFIRSLGAAANAVGNEQSSNSTPAGDGHRITTVEVTTDPVTLRPHRVSFVNDIELTMDGRTRTDTETREWRFDWSSLKCD